MPSTYSTGFMPGSIYKTLLTTAQTQVWSSGSFAEFQDGSHLILRDGARLANKSYAKTSGAGSITDHGVSYLYSSQDMNISLPAPSEPGLTKKIIVGSATSLGMIYVSCTKAVSIHQTSKHCITFSSHAQLKARVCNPWVELYAATTALWLLAGHKTSAAEIMAISSSTDFTV